MNEFIDFLPPLRQPCKAKVKKTPMAQWCKDRYQAAHELNFNEVAKAAGHYFTPTMPDCNKSNGLTTAIEKFLLWNGHRATRQTSSGRLVKANEKQPSGTILAVNKYIPGRTRKGTADIGSTINGRSVMIEIKIGNDKPSEYQLREQAIERKAGGVYEFIKTFEQFLTLYDSL